MNYQKRNYYKPRPLHTVTNKKKSSSDNSSVTSGNITSDEEKYMNHHNEEKNCFYRNSHHVLKIMQDGQILEEDSRKIEEKGNFCASELTVAPNVKKISLPGFL